MAGFTTTALLIGGALAGGILGGSKLANRNNQQQQQDQTLAPGPTDQNALAPPAPPVINPADANAAANQAALRQRKRAARGSLLTNPVNPSTTMPVAPRTAQRTLLGS